MEHLNKIELRGIIGSVRIQNVADTKVANLSVATNSAFKSHGGEIVIETTWHNVVAWEGSGIAPLDQLTKGAPVHVCGRLRTRRYMASDGTERAVTDIVAGTLKLITE